MKDNLIYFPDVWQNTMEDYYREKKLEEIKEIAKMHNLTGIYKYNKETLISYVIENILEPECMKEFFLTAAKEELLLFEELAYDDVEEYEEEAVLMLSYFYRGGYVIYEEDGSICVPEEVKEAYDAINTMEFQKSRDVYETAYSYCTGLAYLYGAVSVEEITRIYNFYEKKNMDETEMLFDIFLPSMNRNESLIYKKDMIVERFLIHEDAVLENVLDTRKQFEPYMPSVNEIYEMSRTVENPLMIFGAYLMKQMRMPAEHAMGMTELIVRMLKIGTMPEEVFCLLQKEDITFLNQEQAEEFAGELGELWMNLRLYTTYGHTPLEIEELFPEKTF